MNATKDQTACRNAVCTICRSHSKELEESVLSAAKDKLIKGTPNSATVTRVPTKNTPPRPIQPTNPNQPSPANVSLSVVSDDLDDDMKGSDEGQCVCQQA